MFSVNNRVMNHLEKLSTIFLLILLAACDPHQQNKTISDSSKIGTLQCLAQQSQCQFEVANGQVQVLFDVDKIVAEQSFNLVVIYHGSEKIANISGYLEGVDMFMGKIPLFIEPYISERTINNRELTDSVLPVAENAQQPLKKQQVFQAEVLVGSCSAEQMTWRLWLSFTISEEESYRKMLTLVSYRR